MKSIKFLLVGLTFALTCSVSMAAPPADPTTKTEKEFKVTAVADANLGMVLQVLHFTDYHYFAKVDDLTLQNDVILPNAVFGNYTLQSNMPLLMREENILLNNPYERTDYNDNITALLEPWEIPITIQSFRTVNIPLYFEPLVDNCKKTLHRAPDKKCIKDTKITLQNDNPQKE